MAVRNIEAEKGDHRDAVGQGDGAVDDVGALDGDKRLALLQFLEALAGLEEGQGVFHVHLELGIVVAAVEFQPAFQQLLLLCHSCS